MSARLLITLVFLLALSCERSPKRLEPVPAELEPKVSAAKAAIGDLKKTLSGRLMRAVKSGGPQAGIEVCSTEAKKLTAEVAARRGVRIGRTSHKLRNPEDNAPRPWLGDYLSTSAGQKAASVEPAVFDLGSSLGVVEPLATQPLCLTCHGDAATLPAEVKQALASRYPKDRATGFAPGDVRGVVWVEIDKH